MSKLIEAMERFEKDYINPPEMKTLAVVEKNYVYIFIFKNALFTNFIRNIKIVHVFF